MKRAVYIILFVLFGILLQFLAHAALEIWYIQFLTEDFETYGLGFSWAQWFLIHHIAAVLLFILGAALGFWQGRFWYPRLYDGRGLRR